MNDLSARKILLTCVLGMIVILMLSIALHPALIVLILPWMILVYAKLINSGCPTCKANLGSHLQNMDLFSGKCLDCAKSKNT